MTDGSAGRDERPMRLLLVGMMGSGKTTVGRALAQRTGWPYLDNDELVRRATARTAYDLLAERGVGALRSGEDAALREALREPPPLVASVAAGVVLDPEARRALRSGGFVAWLRARPDTLAARIVTGPERPWVDEDPRAWLSRRAGERAPLYREVADVVVDVDSRSVDEIVATILAGLDGPIGDRPRD